MPLELLKVIVQPVVLERDQDGRVVGEKTGEPTALYQVEQLAEFVDALHAEIAAQNAAQNGHQPEEE